MAELPPDVRRSYNCDTCRTTTPYTTLPGTCAGCGRTFTGPAEADPDRACPHEDFECVVAIQRIADGEGGPVIAYFAEVSVTCVGCSEKFRFTGCPAGQLPNRPTVSVDEAELRAPIRPASADPDFGLGLPGFAVRYTERSALDDE